MHYTQIVTYKFVSLIENGTIVPTSTIVNQTIKYIQIECE